MNFVRKPLMTSSAIFFIVPGFLFLFLPEEILRYLGSFSTTTTERPVPWIWSFKPDVKKCHDQLVYKRPVVRANLTNFWIVTIALIKITVTAPLHSMALQWLTIYYFILSFSEAIQKIVTA